jgi:hypothetical protein
MDDKASPFSKLLENLQQSERRKADLEAKIVRLENIAVCVYTLIPYVNLATEEARDHCGEARCAS